MTYKDIILKLLKSREGLVCVEDHLVNDFYGIGDPKNDIVNWCNQNHLTYERINQEAPTRLRLRKAGLLLDYN